MTSFAGTSTLQCVRGERGDPCAGSSKGHRTRQQSKDGAGEILSCRNLELDSISPVCL